MNKKLKHIKNNIKGTNKVMVNTESDNMNKNTDFHTDINREKDVKLIKNLTNNLNKKDIKEKSKAQENGYYKENNEDISNEHLEMKKHLNGDSFRNINDKNYNTFVFENRKKEVENSVENIETKSTNDNEMNSNKTNTCLNNKDREMKQKSEDNRMKNNNHLEKEKKKKKNITSKNDCYNEKMNHNNIDTNENELDRNNSIDNYLSKDLSKGTNINNDYKIDEHNNIDDTDSNGSITDEKKKLEEFVNNKKEMDEEDRMRNVSFLNNCNNKIVNLNNRNGNNNDNSNDNYHDSNKNNNNNSNKCDSVNYDNSLLKNNQEVENNKSNNNMNDIYINSADLNNNNLNFKNENLTDVQNLEKNNVDTNNKCNLNNSSINNDYTHDNKNKETSTNYNEINKEDHSKNNETLNDENTIKNEDSISKGEEEKNIKFLGACTTEEFINDTKKKLTENLNISDIELLKTMSDNNILQNCEYEEMLNNIIQFNKDKTELNLNRGEIYLNESEYTFTSYFLLSRGFRFHPCEEIKKKKRKELKLEELNDLKKRTKWDNKKIEISKEEKISGLTNADSTNNYIKKEESTDRNNFDKKMEVTYGNMKSDEEIDNIEEKEKKELFDEILRNLKNDFYNHILNIENNFKNLDNEIENNNTFNFQCIIEKLKNKKYNNILYIYNDIYLYLNNLLFLSKPSSYIWMKLHELSTQITNTIYNIQQKKKQAWNKTVQNFQNEETNMNDKKKEEKEKNEINQSINEEEKMAFQLLLSKLHQDIHFELFRKFKNKAMWKTLEGGEIELDDKLTKANVFRDMYNWCKDQLDIRTKRSDASESDSSKDSY